MKNSKSIFFFLAMGTLLFASWAMPNNETTTETKNKTFLDSAIGSSSNCWALEDCFPSEYVPNIVARIEYCYGWEAGDQPEWCKCYDLNMSGNINVLDIVYLSSNLCE